MNLPALALKVSEKFERAGSISQCTMAGLGRGKVVVTIGRDMTGNSSAFLKHFQKKKNTTNEDTENAH